MQMTTKPKVLIVDDAPDNLMLINMLLQSRCEVLQADNGVQAIALAEQTPRPDLILLDVLMPEMDGYDVCKQIKSQPETRDIPVIFLTSRTQAEDQRKGFNVGAIDYITKPINPDVLQARVSTHLQLKNMRAMLLDQGLHLAQLVGEQTQALLVQEHARKFDPSYLTQHPAKAQTRRLQAYVGLLAKKLQAVPAAHFISDSDITLLQTALALLATPPLAAPIDSSSTSEIEAQLLSFVYQLSRAECENFDGSHPQQNNSGSAIPIASRILRVAMVFDALLSTHDYKPALSLPQTLGVLREQRGKHFDPQVVDAALDVAQELHHLHQQYPDET